MPTVPLPAPAPSSSWSPRRLLAWPFLGPRGVRGGWRVLAFLALFIAGSELLNGWWPQPSPVGDLPAFPLLGREGLQLLLVVTATVFLGRFEGRGLGDYGLPWSDVRRLGRGLLLGFGAASGLILTLAALGLLRIAGVALSGPDILANGLLWALVFLVVALFEELLLRGYAQAALSRGLGFWPAAMVLSLLFALAHARNPGETVLGLIAVGCFGLFFCYTLRVTGNLWLAVGFHAAWDWAESFFYGVPDSGTHIAGHWLQTSPAGPAWLSGGTAGPEGSLFVLVVLAAAAFLAARPGLRAGGRLRP
jgi:CAAX protease family protein